MQKASLVVAVVALAVALTALFRPSFTGANAAPATHATAPDAWHLERQYPPLVFNSKARLDCAISSTQNGRQVMTTVSGQGFTFGTAMLPIKDGKVHLKAPGMLYKFNAFPTKAIPARFTGLGEGTITAMKAEVEVDVKRFQQPGGPGTNILFHASDINPDAAYVEFTGVWVRQGDHKHFPFRVLFGNVPDGGGNVQPSGPGPDTRIMAKRVELGTVQRPATVTTALYEAEEDVPSLKD